VDAVRDTCDVPPLSEKMYRSPDVYAIGTRFAHHSGHSGYEAFVPYVGRHLTKRRSERWLRGLIGWPVNQLLRLISRHPWYSPGSLLAELSAMKHMRQHAGCLYHILYCDYDCWLLPRSDRASNVLVGTFHQPVSQLAKYPRLKKIVKLLDAVILVSESQRSFFSDVMPAERVFVVPHSIDTSFFKPGTGLRQPNKVVTVGTHLRDFDALGRAMRLVWERNPEVRFVALGIDDARSLNAIVDNDRRLEIVGKVSDDSLRRHYQSASIALFALEDATANNAVLEAMACGLPVVATDVGGVSEYLDANMAILCPPQNPESLASGIFSLLANERNATRMSLAASRRALDYDNEIVAIHIRRIYTTLLRSMDLLKAINHVK
jgi:glycosyltransferase involved in cell wall biosynthesis